MKRVASMIFIFAGLVSFLSGCQNKPYEGGESKHDFRNVDWGMTRAQVEKAEGDDFTFASDDIMLYGREEDGDEVILMYEFVDDKLVSSEITVPMGEGRLWSERVPELIESHHRFRERLIELYGQPIDDDYELWIDPDPDYINDSQMYNLYYERLRFLTEWENDESSIKLELYYENRNFNYIVRANQKQG